MKPVIAAQAAVTALASLYEGALVAAHGALARHDSESLHDIRVALRRLAVLLEHLAPATPLRKKLLRDIRRLLKQSNRGRDAQVMLDWLHEQWPHLSDAERIGARQWQRRLHRQLGARVLETKPLAKALHRLLPDLTKLFPPHTIARQPLGLLVAHVLAQQSDELVSLLSRDGAAGQLHLIRLKAKTVRYLLLPFIDGLATCAQADSALRQVQTVLGDWHDAVLRQQSLHHWLRKKIAALTCDTSSKRGVSGVAERSPALPGLLALARANYLAQQRLVAHITRNYLHQHGLHLSQLLQRAVAELSTSATADG